MSSARSRKLIDPAMAARSRMSVASGAVRPIAMSLFSMSRRLVPSAPSREQPAWRGNVHMMSLPGCSFARLCLLQRMHAQQ